MMMQMFLLPPQPHLCQVCGSDHEAELPHNPQSMYYQVSFQMEHGRAPDWRDAMAHCSEEMKSHVKNFLAGIGVDVEAGQVVAPSVFKKRPRA